MSIAISLIALALGYRVFTDAAKEKEGLKVLGQAIGIFVMVAALIGTICGVVHKTACFGKMSCPMMSKSSCPLSSSNSASNNQS